MTQIQVNLKDNAVRENHIVVDLQRNAEELFFKVGENHITADPTANPFSKTDIDISYEDSYLNHKQPPDAATNVRRYTRDVHIQIGEDIQDPNGDGLLPATNQQVVKQVAFKYDVIETPDDATYKAALISIGRVVLNAATQNYVLSQVAAYQDRHVKADDPAVPNVAVL